MLPDQYLQYQTYHMELFHFLCKFTSATANQTMFSRPNELARTAGLAQLVIKVYTFFLQSLHLRHELCNFLVFFGNKSSMVLDFIVYLLDLQPALYSFGSIALCILKQYLVCHIVLTEHAACFLQFPHPESFHQSFQHFWTYQAHWTYWTHWTSWVQQRWSMLTCGHQWIQAYQLWY